MPDDSRLGPAPTRAWPTARFRRPAAWLGLIALLMSPIAHAALPAGGSVDITLDHGVPFAASDYRKHKRSDQPALHLTLPIDEAGQIGDQGWAWFDGMPAVEHPVTVAGATWADNTLSVELAVTFRHNIPLHAGGAGKYQITLARDGGLLRGEYVGAVTGLDKAQRAELWVSLDPQFKATSPAWRGGVESGKVRSVLRVPIDQQHLRITAHGKITPKPGNAHDAPRPGLLFPRGQAEALVSQPNGKAMLDVLRDLLAADATGSIRAGDGLICHGYAAAGHALLAATGDDSAMDKSAASAMQSVETIGDAEAHRLARELMGLAVAYDIAGKQWDDATRRAVQTTLVEQAVRLAALEPPATLYATHVGPGGVLGTPADAADYRLAMLRGSAGLAALSLAGDELDDAQRARVDEALAVCERSIARFCAAGIGDHGAGNTNHGYDEALETVLPFLLACRNVTGIDLAAGTGADRVAAWGAMTDRLGFDNGQAKGWVVAASLIASPRDRKILHTLWANDAAPANPLQVIQCLLALAQDGFTADVAWNLPNVWEDRRMGAYVFRSSDRADGFVTICEAGRGAAAARYARGRVSIAGLGRQWLARDDAPFGDFGWPSYRRQNRFQVYESLLTQREAAAPLGRAQTMRRRASRDGSGSVGLKGNGWAPYDMKTGRVGEAIEAKYTYGVRTVGVDYSGASGADAMLVFVESQLGLEDRQRVWEANVGPLPREAVKISGMSFTITPTDGDASMRGTVLYPPTASIEYLPPHADSPGASGRLRIHMIQPGPGMKELFDKSMNDTVDALKLMQNDDPDRMDVEFEEFDIDFFTDDYPRENKEQLNAEANVIFNKHIKVTTSTSMGGPNVYPTARNGFVMVLTIDAAGDHPDVEVLPAEDQALLKVGGQKVTYWEYLIDFAKKGGE